MVNSRFFCRILILSLLILGSSSYAATLTVGSGGTYTTLNSAFTAANPGDVIEVIESGVELSEQLNVTKTNITIRGKAGLAVKPTWTATGTWAWPDDAVVLVGDGSTNTDNGALGDGLVLQNLIIKGGANIFATIRIMDGASTKGVTINDCTIMGPKFLDGDDNWDACMMLYPNSNATLNNCWVKEGVWNFRVGEPNFQFGGPANLTINDCTLEHTEATKGRNIDVITGGSLTIDDSILLQHTCGVRNIVLANGYFGEGVALSLTDSIIGTHPDGPGSNDGIILWQTGPDGDPANYFAGPGRELANTALIDNCDFIGGSGTGAGGSNATYNALVFVDTCPTCSVKDTIFTGFSRFWFVLPSMINVGDLGTGCEDFNVYASAGKVGDATQDDLDDSNYLPEGANNLNNVDRTNLYTDRAVGNYTLKTTSPAASHNSTGTPVYAGTNRAYRTTTEPIPEPVTRTVHHTAGLGDYTSVVDAVADSNAGDTILIIDNSAPFVGNLIIRDASLTIKGDPTLNPRPTIEGDGTPDPVYGVLGQVLFPLAEHPVIENLILDGRKTSIAMAGWNGGTNGVYKNLYIIGPAGDGGDPGYSHSQTFNAWFPCTVTDCVIEGGRETVVTEGGGVAGEMVFTNCIIRGASDAAVRSNPGVARTLTFRNCDISQKGANRMFQMSSPTPVLNLYDCLIRPDSTTGGGTADSTILFYGSGPGTLVVDNCDLMGPAATTHNAITLLPPMTKVSVTDSIMTNYNRYWWFEGATVGNQTLIDGCEDYNFYGNGLPNDIATADEPEDINVYPAGAHNVNLLAEDPLYANVPVDGIGADADDFKLLATSQALTTPRSSVGTQTYAGSQGGGGTAIEGWELY